jgi:hypothetical protein
VEEAQMGGFGGVPVLLFICFHSFLDDKPESGRRIVTGVASELRVKVTVYNGVGLSPIELSGAEQEAEKIFRYAGIQLTWSTGLLVADVKNNTPSKTWNPASLHLRIWTRAMAAKGPTNSETLGFCLSLDRSDAVVLIDAIQKRAVFGTTNFVDLLGLAMAHELGHLLLRSPKHSATGIMRARWTEKGLAEDDRGYLRFTTGEAQSMQNEVRRRIGLKSLDEIATDY